jgi:outer membrane protein assembly factor BamB
VAHSSIAWTISTGDATKWQISGVLSRASYMARNSNVGGFVRPDVPFPPFHHARGAGKEGRRLLAGSVAIIVGLTMVLSAANLALPSNRESQLPVQDLAADPTDLAICKGGDWSTYLGENTREATSPGERSISPATASSLVKLWNYTAGNSVVANPAIVAGEVYIGSWDGFEYALNATTGHVKWKDNLGTDPHGPSTLGITSSATVSAGVVYVGGGNSFLYAINATNGHILWKVLTGNNSRGFYNWGSPLVADGFIYIGLSSDVSTNVTGGLLQVSLTTHARVHFFNTTANGTLGGSIWTTPAYNAQTNEVYVTTGSPGVNGSIYAESILAFNATSLGLLEHWTIPVAQRTPDGDFGATPLLFTTSSGRPMVVASDKNGILYAWNQSNLAAGPIWQRVAALASPLKGNPNLGPVSLGAGMIFVGTSGTNLSGKLHNGSVQAFVAGTGKPVWQLPLAGPVLSAPVYANGVLAFGAGNIIYVVNATNGKVLFQYTGGTHVLSWGAASVAHGEIVIGGRNDKIFAFGLKTCMPSSIPDALTPAGDTNPNAPLPAAKSEARESEIASRRIWNASGPV